MRRSTRQSTRRSSGEYQVKDEEHIEDEIQVETTEPRRPKPRVTLKRTRKSKWDISTVLTSDKSPLASSNLRSILRHPLAWECLSQEERQSILAFFPSDRYILDAGSPNARPNIEKLLNDDSFRHDCVQYTEDISLGRHDPDWLAEAWGAHDQRKAGCFKEYLERKLEEDWSVSPSDLEAVEADTNETSGPAAGGEEMEIVVASGSRDGEDARGESVAAGGGEGAMAKTGREDAGLGGNTPTSGDSCEMMEDIWKVS